GLLFHDERRATLRAWLRGGHVWRREIAIWIPLGAVGRAKSSSSAVAHAAALHKFAFIAFRALDTHGDRPRVLALRVSGAADKLAKPAVLFDQAVSVQRTFFVERFIRLVRDARPGHQPPRGFTIRIARARQKSSKPPAL